MLVLTIRTENKFQTTSQSLEYDEQWTYSHQESKSNESKTKSLNSNEVTSFSACGGHVGWLCTHQIPVRNLNW